MGPQQGLETEFSAFQSSIFICKSSSYHVVKHFMSATNVSGMSGHRVYSFSPAQLTCFYFNPEPTMSVYDVFNMIKCSPREFISFEILDSHSLNSKQSSKYPGAAHLTMSDSRALN